MRVRGVVVDASGEGVPHAKVFVEDAGSARTRVEADDVGRFVVPRLRHGDVRLVDEQDVVVGQVVEQRPRRLAGLPAGEVARVVLDAVAEPDFAQHLQVEVGALVQALGEDVPPVTVDANQMQQVFINLVNNAADAMPGGGILKVVTTLVPDGKRVATAGRDGVIRCP